MHSTRNITAIFSVILLLAGTAWFYLTGAPQIKLSMPTHIHEHRFTALEVQQFDKTGHPVYLLNAPTTYHIPNQDTHHLNTPHILVTKPKQPALTIQSEEAIVTPKAEEIQFLKHVRVHHAAYQNQAAGVFKTEAISYFPKRKWLETPLDIIWDQENNHLKATGMQANLLTQQIHLLKNIQGTYTRLEDTSHLHANHVTTRMNKKNKLTRATAFGSAEKQAHFWTSATEDKHPLHAYADTIYYHPIKHQLELIGHAEIKQGSNQLNAPHMLYDTQAKHLLTTAENNEKTVILINPDEHPEKHL